MLFLYQKRKINMKVSTVFSTEQRGHSILQSCLYGFSIMWLTSLFSLGFFPVPMTMQTCGLQMIAFLMSPANAFFAVGSWLFAGAMGVPCFSGGRCGVETLFGPTSGYFLGMLLVAPLMSFLVRHYQKKTSGMLPHISFHSLFSVSFLGVILTLFLGYGFLSFILGCGHKAWCVGVKPFLVTDTIKALFGCLVIRGMVAFRDKYQSR
jgi:biotin transport system substrate-specific component